jgi:hypothetical protein
MLERISEHLSGTSTTIFLLFRPRTSSEAHDEMQVAALMLAYFHSILKYLISFVQICLTYLCTVMYWCPNLPSFSSPIQQRNQSCKHTVLCQMIEKKRMCVISLIDY